MDTLRDTHLIFVTGPEGSGTTMLLRFLSRPEGAVALGGSYASFGYDEQRGMINAITLRLWDTSIAIRSDEREKKKKAIQNIRIPDGVSHVVYKRSFPFAHPHCFPRLGDVCDLSSDVQIVVAGRDPAACAASTYRQGHAKTIEEAAQRIRKGVERLSSELAQIESRLFRVVSYERAVSDPRSYTGELEEFLRFPEGALQRHARHIAKPSVRSRAVGKKYAPFLKDALKDLPRY